MATVPTRVGVTKHGGRRDGAGRPRQEPTALLGVRVPVPELSAYTAKAAANGETLSAVVRRLLAKWLRSMRP